MECHVAEKSGKKRETADKDGIEAGDESSLAPFLAGQSTLLCGFEPLAEVQRLERAHLPAAAASSSGGPSTPPPSPAHAVFADIDADGAADSAPGCAADIFMCMRLAEHRFFPLPDFMSSVQTDVNSWMRAILIDWIVEVCEEQGLADTTLFLAAVSIDRCLCVMPIMRTRLQLLGITCLLMSSKMEDVRPPTVRECAQLTDGVCTSTEILQMERPCLAALDFNFHIPTTILFLPRFLKAANADPLTSAVAHFLVYHSVVDYAFCRFLPSQTAASAVVVALHSVGLAPWSATFEHYVAYTREDLRECVAEMLRTFSAAPTSPLRGVWRKYRTANMALLAVLHHPSGNMPPGFL